MKIISQNREENRKKSIVRGHIQDQLTSLKSVLKLSVCCRDVQDIVVNIMELHLRPVNPHVHCIDGGQLSEMNGHIFSYSSH